MLSLRRTWAVARYELTWDFRRKRTYVLLGIFLFIAFAIGYAVPLAVGKSAATSIIGNFSSDAWWVTVVLAVFLAEISGLFPLLIGGFISTDSLASEFDKNTIVPLLSQPVRRLEVYAGKLLEKFLVMLAVSVALTALAIVAAEASVGGQAHFEWFPWVVLLVLGAFMEYTALAFFFGSFLRSGTMVLGILLGVFLGIVIGVGVLALKVGLQEWMNLLPIANVIDLVYVGTSYIASPSGSITLQSNMGSVEGKPNTVTLASAMPYALAGLAINLVVPLVAGYYLFRRAEVRG
jgi:ABC-type transport system involved in multi-copper enzyme maturation permease subunit